ncbi:MAG: nucleotidyl transferase AbiEii/AbiGii toxin family protein [Candidatus Marinimicrobia bacterium]|nr:nucleotidyl transferase AbiEii/AbiGii toxin family protein [Candidatus Neomarinimicrobiota bacterium]
MSYISIQSFSRDSILKQRESIGKADPALLEKTIYSLELIAQLSLLELDFVFKGGTSLLLLDHEFRRLSIDADIITEASPETLNSIFDLLVEQSPFIHWDEQERGKSTVPKHHYRFFFESTINSREDYVLLDVLRDKVPHPDIVPLEVTHPFIEVEKPVNVTVPSLENIIADKLIAFAPETTGIPFDKGKSLQIVKQLFDLGELTLYDLNLNKILRAYEVITLQEISYKNDSITLDDILLDTLTTAHLVCQIDLRNAVEDERTAEIRLGLKQIAGYLADERLSHANAKVAASRIALLATIIRNRITDIEWKKLRYTRGKEETVADVTLPKPYHLLNRLRKGLPESFYYWAKLIKYTS